MSNFKYEDEECYIKCKDGKFIVESHSTRGTDKKETFTELSKAIEALKNSPGF